MDALFLFVLALGWVEIAVFSLLLFFLLIAVAYDRNGRDSYKWFLLFSIPAIYSALHWHNISYSETMAALLSVSTLIIVAKYFGIGLLYSAVEFRMVVREAAKKFAKVTIDERTRPHDFGTHVFMQMKQETEGELTPFVNRGLLRDNISAWTILWPMYFLNMIFGKFLYRVFDYIADIVVQYTKNYVQRVFAQEFNRK